MSADRFPELNNEGSGNGVLYRALKANKDFRLLFADRVYKHFFNGGALTQQNVNRRFNELRSELVSVIPNMNTYIVDTWTPSRQSIFLAACVRDGMYTIDGPGFTVGGTSLYGGNVSPGDSLRIVPSVQGSPVYYTLDGSDPVLSDVPQTPTETTLVARDAAKRVLVPTGRGRGRLAIHPLVRRFQLAPFVGRARRRRFRAEHRLRELHQPRPGQPDVQHQRLVLHPRFPFQFSGERRPLETMTLKMQYDDGFIVYLNGTEVARRNFDGDPAWNSVAGASHSDDQAILFESIDLSAYLSNLRQGNNVLAIQGMNAGISSSDFLIGVELVRRPGAGRPERLRFAGVYRAHLADPQHSGQGPTSRRQHVERAGRGGLCRRAGEGEPPHQRDHVPPGSEISDLKSQISEAEYIELTNVGDQAINLNLVRFTKGIDFTFSDVELAPGAFCLVVKDREAFEARYGPGLPIAGQFTGSLSDAGERIELVDALGVVIQSFSYRDDWYDITDGSGFSLTVIDPVGTSAGSWGNRSAWRPSAVSGGSPGRSDAGEVLAPGAVVINELLANSAGMGPDWIELRNTTNQAVNIGGWFLSDDDDDLTKYRIAEGTVLPPNGLLVFDENEHFGNVYDPGCRKPFGLSASGETVYLHSGVQGSLAGYSEQGAFGPSEAGGTFDPLRERDGLPEPRAGGRGDARPSQRRSAGGAHRDQRDPVSFGRHDGGRVRRVAQHQRSRRDAVRSEPGGSVAVHRRPGGPRHRSAVPHRSADHPGASRIRAAREGPAVFLGRFSVPASTPVLSWGAGRLNNAGETIQLVRPGDVDDEGVRSWIVVDRIRYSDGSRHEDFPGGIDLWPAQADGLALSLTRVRAGGLRRRSVELAGPHAVARDRQAARCEVRVRIYTLMNTFLR